MSDQTKFLELFLANESDLKAFLRSVVRNRSDFDDAYQTVSVRLLDKFDQYDPQRPFGAWARAVAANEVLSLQRASQRHPMSFDPFIIERIVDAFDRRTAQRDSEKSEAMDHCLESLPTDSRELLSLRYGESMAIAEMAGKVGRTTAATQRMLSRIRSQLGDCIKRRMLTTRRTDR